jgi:L-lactate dehydrogenase complex protein LldF
MSTQAAEFKTAARRVTADLNHRALIQTAMGQYEPKRDQNRALFQNWEQARLLASGIKWDALNHLDSLLEQFSSNLESRGAKVHWAGDAEEARQIIVGICRDKQARCVVKSKAMTGEEIHINEALEAAGMNVVESDLGEFIVQLRNEAPYHIVFPAMHLTRGQIRKTFQDKLGDAPSEEPEQLTMVARRVLRKTYLQADVGITGANFAVADPGVVSITENEGNARLTAALPKTMITLVGIEKVVPRFEDLALFLPMLATMGAGQLMSGYNTLYGGPRQPGESDGPQDYHVVLLDNNRSQVLADPEQRDALRCIRCGACLNVCPVYRHVGGHTYNTTYPGPIGSVITPDLRGAEEWGHLANASSLCGACSEVCPVRIDLHHHLLQIRRNLGSRKPSLFQAAAFKIAAAVFNSRFLWKLLTKGGRFGQRFHKLIRGTRIDPAYVWTQSRDLPPVAPQSFKEYWRARR